MSARFLCLLAIMSACANPGAADSGTFELSTPDLEVPVGADITYCTYVDAEVSEDLDILAFQGQQSQFGHHTILYGARARQPPGTHVCSEADMINVRYLAAGGSEAGAFTVPDGISFRLRAGQQLMIQSHFINTGDRDVTGRSWYTIDTAPPDPSRQVADLFNVVTTHLEVAAHAAGHATAECTIGQDLSLIALGGHAHEWGRHISIARGNGADMLYDQPWTAERMFNPVIQRYEVDSPLRLAAGDRLQVDCDYQNDSEEPLSFPREMCVSFAFYFPADREIDCVDGHWPGS